MKFKYKIILLTFLISNCRDAKPGKVSKDNTKQEEIYDTIKIHLDSIQMLKNQRDAIWGKMEIPQLIDSLKSLDIKKGLVNIKDSEKLFGGHKEMGKYYTNNIPKSIYTQLFPTEEIRIKKQKISDEIINKSELKIYLKQGTIIKEERKYKYLYSLEEKDKCLLLIFTKQGKYNPELDLITISKENFNVIDYLNIYGGIYDSYDINYWYSEFMENYTSIKVTKIENLEFDSIRLDTVEVVYRIMNNGEIIENNREK